MSERIDSKGGAHEAADSEPKKRLPVDVRRWVLRLLMLLAVLAGGRALTQIL